MPENFMKFRTDFVTNSSSSSFVVMTVYTYNGKQYNLYSDMEARCNPESMPMLKDNNLIYQYHVLGEDFCTKQKILKSIKDLCAVLYFNNSYQAMDFKIISKIFDFLIKKLSPRKLIEQLQELEGFEAFEDIDPDDYEDKEELREVVLEVLEESLQELECYADVQDEKLLDTYKELIREVNNLSDIEKVIVQEYETNYGEFTNIYSERLSMVLKEHTFSAVSEEDLEYDEVCDFWIMVMKEKVLMGDEPLEDVTELVEKALSTGDCWDMIPSSVQSFQEQTFIISEK